MWQELAKFLLNNTIVSVGILIAMVTITHYGLTFIRGLHRDKLFEQSRREIAAYMAEGSIPPDAAIKILAMRPQDDEEEEDEEGGEDPAMKLAGAVGWESLDKKDASKLVEARSTMDDKDWGNAVNLTLKGMPVTDAIALARNRSGAAAKAAPA